MPLEIRFLTDFLDSGVQNGGKLASKIEPKSMLSSRGDFFKKPSFSAGKTMILKDSGVEVESQNRPKIDPKTKLGWEGLLASIFHGFWWILEAKMGPSWPPKSN